VHAANITIEQTPMATCTGVDDAGRVTMHPDVRAEVDLHVAGEGPERARNQRDVRSRFRVPVVKRPMGASGARQLMERFTAMRRAHRLHDRTSTQQSSGQWRTISRTSRGSIRRERASFAQASFVYRTPHALHVAAFPSC
jgi:hypothetical protein